MTDREPIHIYLIAGEPSGDALAARLMQALTEKTDGAVVFSGVGGPLMHKQGLKSLFPMSDLSVMGVAEIVPKLPMLINRINKTINSINELSPAIVITVDAPDFCHRVAKKIRPLNIPMVHYVAPSVWAWRPARARKIARLYDHLLTLLPFEPPYFEKEGLPTTFIGHSVIESGADKGDGDKFRRDHHMDADQQILMVLPGSRMGEVGRHMEIFRKTVEMVLLRYPDLQIVIPTLEKTASYIAASCADWRTVPILVEGESAKFDAMAASNVAIAASGTVALELALAALPSVIGYKMNSLTATLARLLIKLDHVNLVNIILGRSVVPEFLLENCRADYLSAAVIELLDNPEKRHEQIEGYKQAMLALGHKKEAPGARAADIVLKLIKERKQNGIR